MTTRRYAQGTSVPASRSQAEVRRILHNAGADGLVFAEDSRLGIHVIQFTLEDFVVRMRVEMAEDDELGVHRGRVNPTLLYCVYSRI